MLKRYTALLLCAAAVISVGLSACGSEKSASSAAASQPAGTASEENASSGEKLKVSVTFDAMKEFTEAVGKDKVDISTIIPAGTEPHDFEPKAQEIGRAHV